MKGIFETLDENKKPENKIKLTKEAQLRKYLLKEEAAKLTAEKGWRKLSARDAEDFIVRLNNQYGNGEKIASYTSVNSVRGNGREYLIKFDVPTEEEFKDIVDSEGRLLSEYSKQKMA